MIRRQQIKNSIKSLLNLTKSDVQLEIDSIRADAFHSEIMAIIEESEGDITNIESYSIDDLVISEEEIFAKIKNEKAIYINSEINEFCWDIRTGLDIFEIQVGLNHNIDIYYHYKNYRNKDYNKVKKHYLKKNSVYRSSVKRMTRERYIKQRSLVAKVLNTASKFEVVQVLKNYNFLDYSLESAVRKFYSLLIPTDYNYLFDGEELKGKLKYI